MTVGRSCCLGCGRLAGVLLRDGGMVRRRGDRSRMRVTWTEKACCAIEAEIGGGRRPSLRARA